MGYTIRDRSNDEEQNSTTKKKEKSRIYREIRKNKRNNFATTIKLEKLRSNDRINP